MTGNTAPDQCYRLHLYVYGKVIRGNRDWRGPIRPGADHRMTGRSAGFPDELQRFCTPDRFVGQWNGSNTVDGRRMPGGAFLYRPVQLAGRLFGLFARIQTRSEEGEGKPGRSYSHCAVLAVEDRWEPALIPRVAGLLFDEAAGCLGVPNYEGQENPLELGLPSLLRADVQAYAATGDTPETPKAVRLGRALARQMHGADLALHGRWLPFALGAKAGAMAAFGRFHAFSHEDDTVTLQPPGFSDANPPQAVIQAELHGEIDATQFPLKSAAQTRRQFIRSPLLRPVHLWPEQTDADLQAEAAGNPVAAGLRDVEKVVAEVVAGAGNWSSDYAAEAMAELHPHTKAAAPGHALAAPPRGGTPATDLTHHLQDLPWRNPDHRAYAEAVDVGALRGASQYLYGRLAALSDPHFTTYRFTADAQGQLGHEDLAVRNALETVLCLSLVMSVHGEMEVYADLLASEVLATDALPRLGLPAQRHGSVFGHMVYGLQHFLDPPETPGTGVLHRWFETVGFPSAALSADAGGAVARARTRFAGFVSQTLVSGFGERYREPGLLMQGLKPWWTELRRHAGQPDGWLFATTPPTRR
jgi:hypothetical protein